MSHENDYLGLVSAARRNITDQLRVTPVEHSPDLSELLGVDVYLKLEFLQVTGSFKVRGAWTHLSMLTAQETAAGVATCSAGNHGIALAYAARYFGIRSEIFLPSTVDPAKRQAIEQLGARVVVCTDANGFDDAEPLALAEAARRGLHWVSAFDDDYVMAGNGGTLGDEVCRQLPDCRTWMVPVGGGGLSAGLVRYLTAVRRSFTMIACQHRLSPSLLLSLDRCAPVTRMPPIDTWAGGIEGGIGSSTFPYLSEHVARDHVALVDERELFAAIRWLIEKHHYLIEPSAAAPLAACLSGKVGGIAGPAVLILTGRNLAPSRLRTLLEERGEFGIQEGGSRESRNTERGMP